MNNHHRTQGIQYAIIFNRRFGLGNLTLSRSFKGLPILVEYHHSVAHLAEAQFIG